MASTTVSAPSTRLPISSLSSESAIRAALGALDADSSALDAELSALLSARAPLDNAAARVRALSPALAALRVEAIGLRETVGATARTAERVGGRVRELDEQMHRVRGAAERVNQVIDLKAALEALGAAIAGQDWEAATRHCARAMAVPRDVPEGRFASLTLPSESSPLPPAQALEEARAELLKAFEAGFARASAARDAAATSRFFKLFPAVGFEAEGLDAYASFVVDLVRVRPPPSAKTSSPLYFIAALTALFEAIARIVDQHAPLVSRYYGPGRMTAVVRRLLIEADRVVGGYLDNWAEERQMQRKLSETQASNMDAASRPFSPIAPPEEEALDVREVDKVLTELAGMAGRWALFRKFLFERLSDDADGSEPASPSSSASPEAKEEPKAPPPEFDAIEQSACKQLIERVLDTYYTPLEVWYTRSTIDKAQRLAAPDTSAAHAGSTAPDDVFYILKSVLARVLATGERAALQHTVARLKDVIDTGYAGAIRRKLDDVYRTAVPVGGARGERAERESRQAFVTLLNDLDVSMQHLERLVRDAQAAPAVSQNFLESEVPAVRDALGSLLGLTAKLRSTLRAGLEQLFAQLVRPRLRTLVPDVYRDIAYTGAGEDAGEGEVVRRFARALDALLDGFRGPLTAPNFALLFGMLVDALVRPWERHVMGLRFSERGAVRFDREVRAVGAHLAEMTPFGDVREKMARLGQVAMVLNLDTEEDVAEFYNGSGISWKLSVQEAQAVAGLRV